MKPCKHCCSSGNTLSYIGNSYPDSISTACGYNHIITHCKYCNGKGWIDENEIISVPRNYVKDEFFETR